MRIMFAAFVSCLVDSLERATSISQLLTGIAACLSPAVSHVMYKADIPGKPLG